MGFFDNLFSGIRNVAGRVVDGVRTVAGKVGDVVNTIRRGRDMITSIPVVGSMVRNLIASNPLASAINSGLDEVGGVTDALRGAQTPRDVVDVGYNIGKRFKLLNNRSTP